MVEFLRKSTLLQVRKKIQVRENLLSCEGKLAEGTNHVTFNIFPTKNQNSICKFTGNMTPASIESSQLPPCPLPNVERPTVRESTNTINTTTNKQFTADSVHRGGLSYRWQWSLSAQQPPRVGNQVEGVKVVEVLAHTPKPPEDEPLIPNLGVRTSDTTWRRFSECWWFGPCHGGDVQPVDVVEVNITTTYTTKHNDVSCRRALNMSIPLLRFRSFCYLFLPCKRWNVEEVDVIGLVVGVTTTTAKQHKLSNVVVVCDDGCCWWCGVCWCFTGGGLLCPFVRGKDPNVFSVALFASWSWTFTPIQINALFVHHRNMKPPWFGRRRNRWWDERATHQWFGCWKVNKNKHLKEGLARKEFNMKKVIKE